LIAIALIGIIAGGIITALGTSSKVAAETRTQETAKDLAISELESIKSQPYADSYTIFYPLSGPSGIIVTVNGTGWAASETIDHTNGVTVGGTSATNTLAVDNSGALSGTITIPSTMTAGTGGTPYDIVITGATSGSQTYQHAFTVTAALAVTLPPTYQNYVSVLKVTPLRLDVYDDHEQQIDIAVSLNGITLFKLSDYRTDY
jgi:type II secretory pathway pseudopilin PulG